ncbi:MAG TPA: LON peptidase substrate-binding domain-containing protein, partial [Polyangiaceae bacterium]|nr:LON peptidase substrate-binding domain-containing protein [Polyangiaceae bacterium]
MMSLLRGGASAPRSSFPLLPLRTGVLFPGTMITLPVGRKRSVALVESLTTGDVIGVVTQRDPKIVDPKRDDLYDTGTFVRVAEVGRVPSGEYRLTLEGLNRFTLTNAVTTGPFWLGDASVITEVGGDTEEARLLGDSL